MGPGNKHVPLFVVADIEENLRRKAAGRKKISLSSIAIGMVRRTDPLFEIERSACVPPTMPLKEACAVSLLAGKHGCSGALIAEDGVPRPCTV